jgi:hypothetical protein
MRKNIVPEWAIGFVLSSGTVTVDGKEHEYHVLSRRLEPRLPGFLGFPGGSFLFISEDVPSTFVSYVLGHEVREFTTLAGQPGRCLASLQTELTEVPAKNRLKYIAWRRNFFERLVAYLRGNGESSTELYREVSSSLAYLRHAK